MGELDFGKIAGGFISGAATGALQADKTHKENLRQKRREQAMRRQAITLAEINNEAAARRDAERMEFEEAQFGRKAAHDKTMVEERSKAQLGVAKESEDYKRGLEEIIHPETRQVITKAEGIEQANLWNSTDGKEGMDPKVLTEFRDKKAFEAGKIAETEHERDIEIEDVKGKWGVKKVKAMDKAAKQVKKEDILKLKLSEQEKKIHEKNKKVIRDLKNSLGMNPSEKLGPKLGAMYEEAQDEGPFGDQEAMTKILMIHQRMVKNPFKAEEEPTKVEKVKKLPTTQDIKKDMDTELGLLKETAAVEGPPTEGELAPVGRKRFPPAAPKGSYTNPIKEQTILPEDYYKK